MRLAVPGPGEDGSRRPVPSVGFRGRFAGLLLEIQGWALAGERSRAGGPTNRLAGPGASGQGGRVEWTEIDREDFRNLLAEVGGMRMPFGKYGPQHYPPGGVPLIDLPPEYLSWFKQRGFPKGRLGELLELVHEVKAVGMDEVFGPLRAANGGRYPLHARRTRYHEFE
jgi:uncharacterized protein (DUF3820 family)